MRSAIITLPAGPGPHFGAPLVVRSPARNSYCLEFPQGWPGQADGKSQNSNLVLGSINTVTHRERRGAASARRATEAI